MKLLLKFAHFPSVMSEKVECFCDELKLKSVFSLTNFIPRLCQLSCSQSEFQCQHNKLKHTAIIYDTWSLLTGTKIWKNVSFTGLWIIFLGGKVFILLFFFIYFHFVKKIMWKQVWSSQRKKILYRCCSDVWIAPSLFRFWFREMRTESFKNKYKVWLRWP